MTYVIRKPHAARMPWLLMVRHEGYTDTDKHGWLDRWLQEQERYAQTAIDDLLEIVRAANGAVLKTGGGE